MSDELVTQNHDANLPDHANRMQDLLAGITNISNSIAEAGGVASGVPFIGINGDGVWSWGQERTLVEPRSQWAFDVRTLAHGYIAWPDDKSKDRKPLGEKMVPASMTLPAITSMPDVGTPWQLQFGCEMKCFSGEDDGVLAQYKNGSSGAKTMIKTLVEEVRKQARRDATRLIPICELEIRPWFSQEWKKTFYAPIAKIVRWISEGEYDDHEQPEPVVAAIEPPTAAPAAASQPRAAARGQGRTAPTPEPAPAPEPAPRRRRQA
jgi:hypothetical protein